MFQERQVDGILLLHENTPQELEYLCSLVDIPVVLASINIFGGFAVTSRMLAMYKKKDR